MVFAVGVFEAAPKQLAGVAFIVDKSVDDRYKEAVRYIAKTIQVEKDLTEKNMKSRSRLAVITNGMNPLLV